MIYTVISDYRKLIFDSCEESFLSSIKPELSEYIKKPNSEEQRLARLGGYLLLYRAVRFLFGREDFEIDFGECGKPRFVSGGAAEGLSFNLSHSGGLCAVTVTDEAGEIGVDLQERIDDKRIERLKERFLNYESNALSSIEPIYLFGAFAPDGNCLFAGIPHQSLIKGDVVSEPTDSWSLTEAILKCDGRGFSARGEILKDTSPFSAETVRFNYKGVPYSVSTVLKSF